MPTQPIPRHASCAGRQVIVPKPLDRRERNREYDARRRKDKPWRALYGTAKWRSLRAAQLLKQPLCERCERKGRVTPATVAHHRRAHKGDHALFFDPDNLSSSCAPCHDQVEQIIEARGFEVGCDREGRPIAAGHPWNAGR